MTHAIPVDQINPNTLPRVLGLFDATAMVVGSIIGSGIFLSKVAKVDQQLMAWGFLPIIAVWVFVGFVTLCGSLSLAELATMYPHAGGPYLYLREAYGRLPAFLWGWTEFWVVRSATVGALSCASVIYLDEFLKPTADSGSPLGQVGQLVAAVSIVVGLSVINIISTRWGAAVQNLAMLAKVGFLGLLIVLPIVMGKAHVENLTPLLITSPENAATSNTLFTAIGVALIAVFWPYDGWINIAPVSEEIREPQRNIPRALALGIGVVVLVYVGANLSYHLVLSMPGVSKSEALAADVFRILFGEWGSKFAALGVMCSTFGAANSNLICGPRIYFAAARDGLVPEFIQRVDPRFHTPANSILIQGIWTTVLIFVFFAVSEKPIDVFDAMTDAVICAGLIFYSLAVAAVYVLRFKLPNAERPYRTWGYPLTPGLMIVTYAVAFEQQLIAHFDKIAWVLALIVAGVVYYAVMNRTKRA